MVIGLGSGFISDLIYVVCSCVSSPAGFGGRVVYGLFTEYGWRIQLNQEFYWERIRESIPFFDSKVTAVGHRSSLACMLGW